MKIQKQFSESITVEKTQVAQKEINNPNDKKIQENN